MFFSVTPYSGLRSSIPLTSLPSRALSHWEQRRSLVCESFVSLLERREFSFPVTRQSGLLARRRDMHAAHETSANCDRWGMGILAARPGLLTVYAY